MSIIQICIYILTKLKVKEKEDRIPIQKSCLLFLYILIGNLYCILAIKQP